MTEPPKLTKEQQLAELRKRNQRRRKERGDSLVKEVSGTAIKSRLRFWGIIFVLIGTMGTVVSVVLGLQGNLSTLEIVINAAWPVVLIIVGGLCLIIPSNRMMVIAGITLAAAGLTTLLAGSLVWGALWIAAGCSMIIDSNTRRKRQQARDSKKSR